MVPKEQEVWPSGCTGWCRWMSDSLLYEVVSLGQACEKTSSSCQQYFEQLIQFKQLVEFVQFIRIQFQFVERIFRILDVDAEYSL